MTALEIEPENRDANRLSLTGQELTFREDQIIVSKTDPRGVLTYVNKLFLDISGYTEAEMLGRPHNVIRHPHMPRCVFKLMWDTLKTRQEIFAYVVNRCKNGDHYWVLAHVTPTLAPGGEIIGYHSSRRAPKRQALNIIEPLYRELLSIEQTQGSRAGMEAAFAHLLAQAKQHGQQYDQFILSL
jgi:PAS domain S-box-containing protein